MRALQFTAYGSPEVLEWADAPAPLRRCNDGRQIRPCVVDQTLRVVLLTLLSSLRTPDAASSAREPTGMRGVPGAGRGRPGHRAGTSCLLT